MSFLDEVANEVRESKPACTVGAWLKETGSPSEADLRTAANEHSIAAVWRVMKTRGFQFTQGPVQRHLAGDCTCPTS